MARQTLEEIFATSTNRPSLESIFEETKEQRPPLEQIFAKEEIQRPPLIVDIPTQIAIGFGNEALLGFPLFALEKTQGIDAREALTSQVKAGRIARGVGSTAGFLVGLPAAVFRGGAKLGIKGIQLARKGKAVGKFTKATAAGAGALGAFELVKAPEEDFGEKLVSVPISAGLGAALGVAGEALRPALSKAIAKFTAKFRGKPESIAELTRIRKRHLLNNSVTTSERVYMKGQGRGGIALANKIDDIDLTTEAREGLFSSLYHRASKNMTPQELSNFVDVAEGRATAMNPKVEKLFRFWEGQRKLIAQEAGELLPEFLPRQNYFPHIVISSTAPNKVVTETLKGAVQRRDFSSLKEAFATWNSYKNYSLKRQGGQKILDYLVNTKQAKNLSEAQTLLDSFISKGKLRKFSNLEMPREVNLPFYDIHPDRALIKYARGVFHRLESVKSFGPNGEGARELISRVGRDRGDMANVQKAFDRWAGTEQNIGAFEGAISPEMSQRVRGFQTITKLGLAPIPNSTQSINTAYVTTIKHTSKAIKDLVLNKKTLIHGIEYTPREWGDRVGATLQSTIEDVIQRATGGIGGWSRKFLKVIGFTATETMNRTIAANAGREYAISLAKQIAKKPTSKTLRRAIREIGLNPHKLAQSGSVSLEEMIRASQKVVNKSQFRSGVLDLPLFFTSPEGRILTQFKNFAFNQTKLIKDAILGEAAKGNLAPIITAVTLMPVLGEGVKDIKAVLSGRARTTTGIERIAENMAAVGGLGIVSDLWQSASFGKFTGALFGPTISDTATFIEALTKIPAGKGKPLGRAVVRQIPVGGPLLKNLLFPSEKR